MPADPNQIIARFESLKSHRTLYEPHWENIAEFLLPRKRGMRGFGAKPPEGQKLTDSQYDSTPTRYAEKLAAFIHAYFTSTAYPFFGLQTRDVTLMDVKSVADFLEECSDRMLSAFSMSNWDTEAPESYLDAVLFGTASPMFVEEAQILVPGQVFGGLHFSALPLAEVYLAENRYGTIDTLFWLYDLPATTVVKTWGDKVSQTVHSLVRNSTKPYEPVKILMGIYPREDAKSEGYNRFAWDMPFACCFLEYEKKGLLEERGFHEFPSPSARWSKANADRTYGRGLGDTAYPDVRTLNELVRYKLMSLAMAIFPPLLKDQGLVGKVRMLPGAVNIVNASSLSAAGGLNPPIQPLVNGARFDVAEMEEEKYRVQLREIFYSGMLELPEKGPQMTAREVQIRLRIMQQALGATLGRFKSELVAPIISRAFGMMLRAGVLPEPPEELLYAPGDAAEIDVVYKGPLAMAQRTDDALSIEGQADYILSVFERTHDAAVLDTLDFDEAAWARGEATSVPSKVMRGREQVEKVRERRREANARARQSEEDATAAENEAAMAKASKARAEAEATGVQSGMMRGASGMMPGSSGMPAGGGEAVA